MTPREETPLLVTTATTLPSEHNPQQTYNTEEQPASEDNDETKGTATMGQTMLNIAKACMGPGCLVLPYAARQGGLLLHSVGLLAMGIWNIYTIQRLCKCLDYLPPKSNSTKPCALYDLDNYRSNPIAQQRASMIKPETQKTQHHPPEGTAMFGQVMWYATGPKGLWALDVLMLSFLLGILVTYINAMRGFLKDIAWLSTQNDVIDALGLVSIMAPLSFVAHMGYLAKASALGLGVLALSFVVFLAYGLEEPQLALQSTLSWYPQNGLWGVSHWFGCVVFSFGVAPLTYNFRSSMADPQQMVPAASYTLLGVAVVNMMVGIGFWILFPSIEGDLLQELPTTAAFASITRVAMVVVVLTTTPLLIVPCGELLEGKAANLVTSLSPQTRRIVSRIGISLVGMAVSLYVPGFVDVLSFVGCCCVACLGFTIPPFLHGLLRHQARRRRRKYGGPSDQESEETDFVSPFGGGGSTSYNTDYGIASEDDGPPDPPQISSKALADRSYKLGMALDILMFGWGLFATVVSTTYTFRQMSQGTA